MQTDNKTYEHITKHANRQQKIPNNSTHLTNKVKKGHIFVNTF